ncbi:hypothetical protein [Chengkuizengella sediminis]|uniref:hypothetical protein n=1 Tax=Chengkuizengella sediminis TaxID=1885917 RepID=UPI001389ADD4|nr:hypothetical protein [Chengkuizengella sediminis]NDI34550.1 hypothetical protein [Chengkuizengella sediminis]
MASKKESKKGFSRIAAIALVLFILLVIIIVAARGRSRYGSGGSFGTIDVTNQEELIALTERLNIFNERVQQLARIEQTRQALLQQAMQAF